MLIKINGKETDLPDNASLQDVINILAKNPQHIVAEVDGLIINRILWEKTRLKNASMVELVTFVGGG